MSSFNYKSSYNKVTIGIKLKIKHTKFDTKICFYLLIYFENFLLKNTTY